MVAILNVYSMNTHDDGDDCKNDTKDRCGNSDDFCVLSIWAAYFIGAK